MDIARWAGVSQATVSRALNGGSVSEATRERVYQIIEQHGYSPNAIARGLVTRRTDTIGVVVADISNPFYPELLEALSRNLTRENLILQHAASPAEEERAARLLVQQRVDGIIFTTASRKSSAVAKLLESRFPIVLSNRATDISCDVVAADNVAGGRAVAGHLADLGHRRIAVIQGDSIASTAVERARGFRAGLAERGLKLSRELVTAGNFRYDDAYHAARHLLALPQPPTAIFCHNDLMAFAVRNAAVRAGVAVPEQLSVVGYDDIRQSAWETFDLTTVRQPIEQMAISALQLLRERIGDRDRPFERKVFPSSLVVRGTTAPAAPIATAARTATAAPTATRSHR